MVAFPMRAYVRNLFFLVGLIFFIAHLVNDCVAAGSDGSVRLEADDYILEIPCGYFYWGYIKSGGWGCGSGVGAFRSVSLLATVDGLKPYSEETADKFIDYKNGNSAGVIDLLLNDISYAPYMSNYGYFDAYLSRRRARLSEYDGLSKYVISRASGAEYRVVYIDQPEAGSEWVRFVCYRSKYPYCTAFSCDEDICILYSVGFELSGWKYRHLAIWNLVKGFKKSN